MLHQIVQCFSPVYDTEREKSPIFMCCIKTDFAFAQEVQRFRICVVVEFRQFNQRLWSLNRNKQVHKEDPQTECCRQQRTCGLPVAHSFRCGNCKFNTCTLSGVLSFVPDSALHWSIIGMSLHPVHTDQTCLAQSG